MKYKVGFAIQIDPIFQTNQNKETMSHFKKRLNNYERRYFEKFFGNNVNRLLALRRSLTKRIATPLLWDYDCWDEGYPGCQTVQKFKVKGGVEKTINISRKMIDLYIESLGYNVAELIGPRYTKSKCLKRWK